MECSSYAWRNAQTMTGVLGWPPGASIHSSVEAAKAAAEDAATRFPL